MADLRKTLKRSLVLKLGASIFRAHEKLAGWTLDPVLILGHMRSGSTLLNHILISHEDLIGYGERNAYYESRDDLALLSFQARRNCPKREKFPKYVVDQINHNKFTPAPAVLRAPQIRFIFLLREPMGSVSSLLRELAPRYGFGVEDAISYYIERLAGLSRLAAMTDPRRTAFLTYDDLLHETTPTLNGLARFLELETELREEYRVFDFTGRRGDPGEKIRTARISRTPPAMVELPAPELAKLEAAYTKCLSALSERHIRACQRSRAGR